MADDPPGPNPYAAPAADIAARPAGPRSPAGLRITAGVVLLLVAAVNGLAAIVYVATGVLFSEATVRSAMQEGAHQQGTELTPEELDEATARARSPSLRSAVFWLFLGLSAVTSVMAAVFLFRGKRGGLVVLCALLLGAVELAGAPLNVFGLLAAVLAFVAGVSIANRTAWSG